MRKYGYIIAFLMGCFVANTQNFLSEHARVSLLTTTPCDNAVYTLYGHTSIRVRDSIAPDRKMDYVFNYGQFDASQPNFIYRFAKGETDYMLAYYTYEVFEADRHLLNSSVYEQTLNLTPQEKDELWIALVYNAQPENRHYRYNFFFDNCATRPGKLIEQIIKGQVIYEKDTLFLTLPLGGSWKGPLTFRDMINHCTRNHPWVTFGCDLVLGLPTDRTVTLEESFFIPEYLMNAFAEAQIESYDGTLRPLVIDTQLLVENIPEETPKTILTPLLCSLLLLAIVLYITWIEWRKKKYFRWVDCLLFFIAGIAGCILFFLCFLSEHPSIWPNISIVWLHPLHLVGVVLFAIKKRNKAAYWYHFINFAALLLMSLAWIFIPQHVNMAFIPLIAVLGLRSGKYIVQSCRGEKFFARTGSK